MRWTGPGLDDAWRNALRPFLLTRVATLAVGVLAATVVGYDPPPTEQARWRPHGNALADLPARWDAYWYADIAQHGYRWDPARHEQQNVVFFPAYPLLMRGAGTLAGGHVLWAGLALSLAAFLLALTYLYRLARLDLGEAEARAALALLASYPFALFYGAAYTESLYLLGTTACLLEFRRGGLGRAGAWGVLVGLSRPNGGLLSLALVVLAAGGPARAWRLVVALTPLLGTLAYSAWLGLAFGAPFAWIEGQAAWSSPFAASPLPDLRWGPPVPWRLSDVVVHAGNVAATAFALYGLNRVRLRFGPAYAVFVLVSLVPPLLAHGFQSMGRFTAVLFPLFLWLATVVPARSRSRWTRFLLLGQLVYAALFFSWRLVV